MQNISAMGQNRTFPPLSDRGKLASKNCLKRTVMSNAMRTVRVATLIAAACMMAPPLVLNTRAQSDITGFWVFRVPTGDGNFGESFFDGFLGGICG